MKTIRRIDFFADKSSFECVILGSLGFSTQLIAKKTGLSDGQIYYRLKKSGTRRKDYRNGESVISQTVIARSRQYTTQQIKSRLRKELQ